MMRGSFRLTQKLPASTVRRAEGGHAPWWLRSGAKLEAVFRVRGRLGFWPPNTENWGRVKNDGRPGWDCTTLSEPPRLLAGDGDASQLATSIGRGRWAELVTSGKLPGLDVTGMRLLANKGHRPPSKGVEMIQRNPDAVNMRNALFR